VVIRWVARPAVQAMTLSQGGDERLDNNTWDIQDWYKDA